MPPQLVPTKNLNYGRRHKFAHCFFFNIAGGKLTNNFDPEWFCQQNILIFAENKTFKKKRK
jgi:hypothetical protein